MSAPLAIHAENVVRRFTIGDETNTILKQISLDVPQGQFISIMGASGSGKSTLLYQLGGLDQPDEGHIVVCGHAIEGMQGRELAHFRAKTMGFVFQQPYLIPTMSAMENAAMPGIFAGVDREQREQRATRLLNLLGMGDRLNHRPSQLSGGQMQRVVIARALFNNPPIIMADEPTAALDSKTGELVFRMLQMLAYKQGRTVVVVTHNPDFATYCQRIVYLKDGQIIRDELTPLGQRMQRQRTISKPVTAPLNTEAPLLEE